MNRNFSGFCLSFLLLASIFISADAQPSRSLELSENDNLPVLIKHLPDWQNVRSSTSFIATESELKLRFPGKPVLENIHFVGGTEAATAVYPAGRVLIVEYSSPQGASDADSKVLSYLAANPDPSTVYRRTGNYNVFVFDAADQTAAIALADQVKYEKAVQWLGEDPFLLQKLERYFIQTGRDIMLSTVMWILGGFGLAAVSGVIAGLIFYRVREQRRATWQRFSDAGGLTRLNLDELSE